MEAETPPASDAAKAIALIQQAVALLAITPKSTTARQRQRGLKFRKGAEPAVRKLADLARTHGVSVPGSPTDGMVASLARAQVLGAVRLALVGALRLVDSALYDEQGAAYGTALTLYGMLKKVGHRHAPIKAGLADVEAFFSYRSPAALAAAAERRAAKKAAAAEAAPIDP